jgi:hypothetical protein
LKKIYKTPDIINACRILHRHFSNAIKHVTHLPKPFLCTSFGVGGKKGKKERKKERKRKKYAVLTSTPSTGGFVRKLGGTISGVRDGGGSMPCSF